jgi:TPR repeat protein
MHVEGIGVTKNPEEAVRLFRRASDQGLAEAQYHLGTMYTNGTGVTKDDAEARRWYQKAADQGFSDAQRALDELQAAGSRQ